MQKLLPSITLEETNKLINGYIKEDNRVVILTGPEKEGMVKPTEQEVLNSIKVDKSSITAYVDEAVAESLLRNPVKKVRLLKKNQ
ncbi:hypothetical protein [Flavobacterium piscinae]|uniref:hypothetical protein n=1 Tax=Flavobacterium piscinae TaxID=2506424 RepID=UPI002AAB00C3|nr:hypothetical protein [Flavobacterium piscinae]